MASPETFLRGAYRLLLPGGRLLIEERAPGSTVTRIFARVHRHRQPVPLDFRIADEWAGALRRVGLHPVTETDERGW
jgi:hypothetical protein